MREALWSIASGWGLSYLAQLASGRLRPATPTSGPLHFIVVVANHFEPLWSERPLADGLRIQQRWCDELAALGFEDADGHPFKHTYFFPAEQYHPELLDPLVAHCAAGFGEVEVHLHHGLDGPDTADNLERTLAEFKEQLASHGCLGRDRRTGQIGYAFVHGNWELANSGRGRQCGVDSEMAILARTGCYVDCTLPSAPDPSQVSVINSIYQCGRPLSERAPHRRAAPLSVGQGEITLPILLQGPLLLDWSRRVRGLPVPRLENGELGDDFLPAVERFDLWRRANVHVAGRPDWVFVKLHTHGLIERHIRPLLGDPMKRFLDRLLGRYNRDGRYRVHFATAREAANMVVAAVAGERGDPGAFRDYRYVAPRAAGRPPGVAATEGSSAWI